MFYARRILRAIGAIVAIVGIAAPASAGTVKTADGRLHEGRVRLDGDAVVVTPASGVDLRIDLAQVADVRFADAPATAPATQPARWESADLNVRRAASREVIDADRITIHDAATGFRNEDKGDSLRFVYQRLPADGQITARIRTFASMRGLVAGLMIRESLDGKSPFAAITRGDDFQPTRLVVRKAAGEEYTTAGDADRAVLGASWLRLVRKGTRFQAFESPDGKTWWPAGESVVPMLGEAPVYVGLVSATGGQLRDEPTVFDNVSIEIGAVATQDFLSAGVMKRDGTLLAGQIAEADLTTIRLQQAGGQQSLVAADAAWLILRPLNDEMLAKLKTARGGGVLMRSGDFIEGELKSASADRVKLNSVLFGARDLAAGREALVVVLRPCQPAGRFQVWLKDGSVLRCDALKVAGNQLELGGASVRVADVVRLRLDP